jgi:hypothetical protein
MMEQSYVILVIPALLVMKNHASLNALIMEYALMENVTVRNYLQDLIVIYLLVRMTALVKECV